MKGLLDYDFPKWISILYDANLEFLLLHKTGISEHQFGFIRTYLTLDPCRKMTSGELLHHLGDSDLGHFGTLRQSLYR